MHAANCSPLSAYPVLFNKSLTPYAWQVTVLPDQLCLAILKQHHQLVLLYLCFQTQKVKGGICLDILRNDKYKGT